MTLPLKFQALSAVYFGLASAVMVPSATAQNARTSVSQSTPATSPSTRQDSATQHGQSGVISNPRQTEFEHPMLNDKPTTDMRPESRDVPTVQRRGMQDMRQDGRIERHAPHSAPDGIAAEHGKTR